MATNIFKGGRRASKIAIGLWLIIAAIFFFSLYIESSPNTRGWYLMFGTIFVPPIVIWAVTCATGYIVRSFLSIPRGQDNK
jgi:hypothetical protein